MYLDYGWFWICRLIYWLLVKELIKNGGKYVFVLGRCLQSGV